MEEESSWLIPKVLVFSVMFSLVMVKGMSLLWWRPRKIEQHFSKQGIRGPPYHFFIGNVKELVGMMLKASSHPMPFSHNILPRVLSFYHHWRKIYGSFFFSQIHTLFFAMISESALNGYSVSNLSNFGIILSKLFG